MNRRWLLLVALTACTEGGELAQTQQAIVGGAASTGDPAVVAIAHRRIGCGDAPPVHCSGVLVAPRVVLTAAHCIEGVAARGALEVVFGASAASPTTIVVVASTQTYPGYDSVTGDGDIAALLLADNAPVTPHPLPTATMSEVTVGAELRAVGFGATGWTANDPGTKREGTLVLGDVRAASFDATPGPAMTCVADSGGPVFARIGNDEQLVGLTSRGDLACATTAVNARLDVALESFVRPFIAASTSAPAATDTAPQAACSSDLDCPALMTCLDDARCGFAWLGTGSFDGACTSDADCGTARCARVWPDGADACHCFAADMTPGPDPIDPMGEPDDPSTGCAATTGARLAWVLPALVVATRRRRQRSR